jgi:flavin reductase (DIM6/NTAB) family NADH-FMN oxidoreductase RutF
MNFDFDEISNIDAYKMLSSVVVPRPIAWVVSQNKHGAVNAAPFSFFNLVSSDPPVIALGVGPRANGAPKDTARNILETGEFVVNLVSHELAVHMNETSRPYAESVDELAEHGLECEPSLKVKPPRIRRSPVALECRAWQTLSSGPNRYIILAHVVALYLSDNAIENLEKFYVDTPALKLVARMNGAGWYTHTSDTFFMPGPDAAPPPQSDE